MPYNRKDPGFSPKTQQTLNEREEGGKAENSKTLGVPILGRLYIQNHGQPKISENVKKNPKNKVILEFGIYPIKWLVYFQVVRSEVNVRNAEYTRYSGTTIYISD